MSALPAGSLPTPVPPDKISFHGTTVKVGVLALKLLSVVLGASHRARLGTLMRSVWGAVGSRGKLDAMVHRLNAKLGDVKCPARLAVDAGRVLIV